MAGEKIKLEEEAISEILVADIELESGVLNVYMCKLVQWGVTFLEDLWL